MIKRRTKRIRKRPVSPEVVLVVRKRRKKKIKRKPKKIWNGEEDK